MPAWLAWHEQFTNFSEDDNSYMTASTTGSLPQTSALPRNLKIRDILKTLPKEVFIKDWRKAWFRVALTLLAVGLGYWGLAIAPWFLLPFLWFYTGTALTGCFVIGHDCGHRSFAQRKWVNNLVGHLMFLPLLYPFHSWRLLHNHHHKHTNKLGEDNAWEPFLPETYENASAAMKWFYRQLRGRFWWVASIAHWAVLHFNWQQFQGKARQQVQFSVLLVGLTAAIAFPVAIATLGFWGVVKFWLLPWLGYHFWMSTFTLVHHTAPYIPFRPVEQWHEAEAQLMGSVHCVYPQWIELLCHDINVHVPHHLSTAIPSYNLRLAHQALHAHWGEYLIECEFSWSLMQQITEQCHLYDLETGYQPIAKNKGSNF